jgi:two-component system, LuxR family, sensor kinase FixL
MREPFLETSRAKVLSATAALIACIAGADWHVGSRASLGVFYVLPVMLAATVLAPRAVVALAACCSLLRSVFDIPSQPLEMTLRFVFAVLAYSGCGMFVVALMRNRDMAVEHLEHMRREQKLRQDAEEQLALLVESSPTAILTTDERGAVLAANNAARTLFLCESLAGKQIGQYVPLLADALRLEAAPEDFRAAAECQGRRENGEIFLAQTWFSCYAAPRGTRLSAIVVDISEEVRDREEEGWRQLMRGNRIAAAAVSHEVRNLCSAISLVCGNLRDRHPLAGDVDFEGLNTLVEGLERVASGALSAVQHETLEPVALQDVLDSLRIVIELDWREIEGSVVWLAAPEMPTVLADRHGLLQAFFNLARNSHRAVQSGSRRELRIAVTVRDAVAEVRFLDSGPGIAEPERLFQPFQPGADGAGLGLYVSRTVVRGYGGELCYEPQESGTCFRVDLQIVDGGTK